MGTHKKPPFLRRRLGRRLRALREEAGLSLDQAAEKLEKTRSSFHRIETGATRADVHFVRSLMDTYDIYVPDLLDQAREAVKPQWFRSYGVEDLGYVDLEPMRRLYGSSPVSSCRACCKPRRTFAPCWFGVCGPERQQRSTMMCRSA
ncbi:helix-turn-helix domain-containing protein [Actinophytocola sediminis]